MSSTIVKLCINILIISSLSSNKLCILSSNSITNKNMNFIFLWMMLPSGLTLPHASWTFPPWILPCASLLITFPTGAYRTGAFPLDISDCNFVVPLHSFLPRPFPLDVTLLGKHLKGRRIPMPGLWMVHSGYFPWDTSLIPTFFTVT